MHVLLDPNLSLCLSSWHLNNISDGGPKVHFSKRFVTVSVRRYFQFSHCMSVVSSNAHSSERSAPI